MRQSVCGSHCFAAQVVESVLAVVLLDERSKRAQDALVVMQLLEDPV